MDKRLSPYDDPEWIRLDAEADKAERARIVSEVAYQRHKLKQATLELASHDARAAECQARAAAAGKAYWSPEAKAHDRAVEATNKASKAFGDALRKPLPLDEMSRLGRVAIEARNLANARWNEIADANRAAGVSRG